MKVNRRRFIVLLGGTFLTLTNRLFAHDWEDETPAVAAARAALESAFAGRQMALDFRRFNRSFDELFRIQINALDLFPVASCFKAWLALHYFVHVPPDEWDTGEYSPVYQMAVSSDNVNTGVVLDMVARRARSRKNAIETFNDFLTQTVGMANGLHTWNWPDSPTVGLTDPRFAPSAARSVRLGGQEYRVDNAFTAADLARGYDFLLRGEYFTRSPELKAAIQAARALLSIPAHNYRSPIERVYADGYTGKDGILPSADISTGRVVNDAGLIRRGDYHYIIAFMSAGESESTALSVLGQVISQMQTFDGS